VIIDKHDPLLGSQLREHLSPKHVVVEYRAHELLNALTSEFKFAKLSMED
jgi:hypothetical protein